MEVLHFRVAECVKHGIIPGRTVRDLFIQVDRDKYPDVEQKYRMEEVINIPTDIWNQFELWMFFNGSKSKLPSILKRAWADKLNSTKKYQLAKYKTKAKIIDLVRICHAHSEDIDELMKSTISP